MNCTLTNSSSLAITCGMMISIILLRARETFRVTRGRRYFVMGIAKSRSRKGFLFWSRYFSLKLLSVGSSHTAVAWVGESQMSARLNGGDCCPEFDTAPAEPASASFFPFCFSPPCCWTGPADGVAKTSGWFTEGSVLRRFILCLRFFSMVAWNKNEGRLIRSFFPGWDIGVNQVWWRTVHKVTSYPAVVCRGAHMFFYSYTWV